MPMKQFKINRGHIFPLKAVADILSAKLGGAKRIIYPLFFAVGGICLYHGFYDMGNKKDMVFSDRLKYF